MIARRDLLASGSAFLAASACAHTAGPASVVEPGASLRAAIAALPAEGGVIGLRPGVYREKLLIKRPNVRLIGLGRRPQDVVLVWSDGARHVGGTFQSWSVRVDGDGFSAANLTIQNDYSLKNPNDRTQAVALHVTADRCVFDGVRLLGAQDTLYAASRACAGEGCIRPASRQYFVDCHIEGEVDFVFGDAKAYFERCRLHGVAYPEIMYTAQSRLTPEQDSGYVFDRCRLTADAGAGRIWLGRPWRDHATVVFLDCEIEASLEPSGWREWTPGVTQRLATATYAEFGSYGRGANPAGRDPQSRQLTAAEAETWRLPRFFPDWRPDTGRSA